MRFACRLILVFLLVLAGCARKGAPSGGPPDLVPPVVVSCAPDSGRARVPLDARISVTFSEGMEPRATGEAVSLAPQVGIRQRRWSGRELTLVLEDSMRANQTYTLFVGPSARDRHGNSMTSGFTVVRVVKVISMPVAMPLSLLLAASTA